MKAECPPCEVCHKPGDGVYSSALGPISHAYCRECLEAHREVYGTLMAGLYGVERENVSEGVQQIIKATLAFYNKTEDELWEHVEAFRKEYDAYVDRVRRQLSE